MSVHDEIEKYLVKMMDDEREIDSYQLFVMLRANRCLPNRHVPGADFTIDKAELEKVLRESGTDPVAFDAAVLLVQYAGEGNSALPAPLTEFALAVMRKERKRPKGRARYKNVGRDFRVRMAVYVAHSEHGLDFTRNDATSRDSACDVVAKCLAKLRLKPDTYTAVAKIWQKRPFD